MRQCVPDLPFWEMVLYMFKVIGAIGVMILTFALIFAVYLFIVEWRKT